MPLFNLCFDHCFKKVEFFPPTAVPFETPSLIGFILEREARLLILKREDRTSTFKREGRISLKREARFSTKREGRISTKREGQFLNARVDLLLTFAFDF